MSATGEWLTSTRLEFPPIDGYELFEELGRGGMGIVIRARQIATNRIVAIKVIRDSAFAGSALRGRFRREADAIARLTHPNIVTIHDVGEANGQPYLAMEFVAGGSLETKLQTGAQPIRDAVQCVRTLADAIAHAHDQNIIHRDLKPANVLFADSRPVIVDFGLAKRLDAETTVITHDGAILGTPGYLSPEQAAGLTDAIGPATDIHALGLILFEMLTAQMPFPGDSYQQLLHNIIHIEPPTLMTLRPDIPVALDAIVAKCLEKEPSKRFASARELVEELDRFLADCPTFTMPLSDDDRIHRAARRDGFTIVEEIGRGPNSRVFHARHDSIAKPLALKVYDRDFVTLNEWNARLVRGRELSSILSHPHILHVERGGWWNNFPFTVMELAPLGNLATAMNDSSAKVIRIVTIVQRIAECVQYFHRQGVVHGNIKPTNIVLATGDIPQLLDYRPLGCFANALDSDHEMTQRYCPPELIANPQGEWHPTFDIYGIGLILFDWLAGRQRFDVTKMDELPAITTIRPDLPPSIDSLIRRCLRENPWQRWKRAYDLSQRLKSIAMELSDSDRRLRNRF